MLIGTRIRIVDYFGLAVNGTAIYPTWDDLRPEGPLRIFTTKGMLVP